MRLHAEGHVYDLDGCSSKATHEPRWMQQPLFFQGFLPSLGAFAYFLVSVTIYSY